MSALAIAAAGTAVSLLVMVGGVAWLARRAWPTRTPMAGAAGFRVSVEVSTRSIVAMVGAGRWREAAPWLMAVLGALGLALFLPLLVGLASGAKGPLLWGIVAAFAGAVVRAAWPRREEAGEGAGAPAATRGGPGRRTHGEGAAVRETAARETEVQQTEVRGHPGPGEVDAALVGCSPLPLGPATGAAVRLFLSATAVLLGVGGALTGVGVLLLERGAAHGSAAVTAAGWGVLLGAVVVGFPLWFRWLMDRGSRALAIPPLAGVPVVEAAQLLARIDSVPERCGVRVMGDDKLGRVLSLGHPRARGERVGAVTGYERAEEFGGSALRLRLEPQRHRVVATQVHVRGRAGGSVGPVRAGLSGSIAWSAGVEVPVYSARDPVRLAFRSDRWVVGPPGPMDAADLRGAAVEVVIGSGWTFAPGLTRPRRHAS